ncbi:MAG: hypothetical protein LBP41_02435 [Holosporaceae bacterium]|nr:hypothetical protein [Holosporaceae bacterium]
MKRRALASLSVAFLIFLDISAMIEKKKEIDENNVIVKYVLEGETRKGLAGTLEKLTSADQSAINTVVTEVKNAIKAYTTKEVQDDELPSAPQYMNVPTKGANKVRNIAANNNLFNVYKISLIKFFNEKIAEHDKTIDLLAREINKKLSAILSMNLQEKDDIRLSDETAIELKDENTLVDIIKRQVENSKDNETVAIAELNNTLVDNIKRRVENNRDNETVAIMELSKELEKLEGQLIKKGAEMIKQQNETIKTFKRELEAQRKSALYGNQRSFVEVLNDCNNNEVADDSLRKHLMAISELQSFTDITTEYAGKELVPMYKKILIDDVRWPEILSLAKITAESKEKKKIMSYVDANFNRKDNEYNFYEQKKSTNANWNFLDVDAIIKEICSDPNYATIRDNKEFIDNLKMKLNRYNSTEQNLAFGNVSLAINTLKQHLMHNIAVAHSQRGLEWSGSLVELVSNPSAMLEIKENTIRTELELASSAEKNSDETILNKFNEKFDEFLMQHGASTILYEKEKIEYLVQYLTDIALRAILRSIANDLYSFIAISNCFSDLLNEYNLQKEGLSKAILKKREALASLAETSKNKSPSEQIKLNNNVTKEYMPAENDMKSIINKLEQDFSRYGSEYDSVHIIRNKIFEHILGAFNRVEFLNMINEYVLKEIVSKKNIDRMQYQAVVASLKFDPVERDEYTTSEHKYQTSDKPAAQQEVPNGLIKARKMGIVNGVLSFENEKVENAEDKLIIKNLKEKLSHVKENEKFNVAAQAFGNCAANISEDTLVALEQNMNICIMNEVHAVGGHLLHNSFDRKRYWRLKSFLNATNDAPNKNACLSMTEKSFVNTIGEIKRANCASKKSLKSEIENIRELFVVKDSSTPTNKNIIHLNKNASKKDAKVEKIQHDDKKANANVSEKLESDDKKAENNNNGNNLNDDAKAEKIRKERESAESAMKLSIAAINGKQFNLKKVPTQVVEVPDPIAEAKAKAYATLNSIHGFNISNLRKTKKGVDKNGSDEEK